MSAILLIARRELGYYFRTWLGYIIIAAALFLLALLFHGFAMSGVDKKSSDVLGAFFYLASGVTMFASVFISMRLLAAERETGTVNLLFSSPVRDHEIVIGKFLAAWTFLSALLVCSLYIPLTVMVAGKISFAQILVGYFGLWLLGGASLAIGTLGSALTRSQILAIIVTALMVIAMITCWFLARITERPLSNVLENMSLFNIHFPPFQSGAVHLRDVVYYLAVIYVALFGATRVLEARRWR
jgi:ABC-2 type transport system permease protein